MTRSSAPRPSVARHWLRPLALAWASLRSGTRTSVAATAVVEEYEQRLLYSADLAPLALTPSAGMQPVEQRVLDSDGDYAGTQVETAAQRVELLIVDAGVADRDTLLEQINSDGGRSIELVILDGAADGITQISAALTGRSDVAALHIVSHGADGELRVGNSVLDAAQLAARSAEIARWGDALAAGADILLYSCEVAADARGEAFVRQFSELTRADVAASVNLTGSRDLGGDWNLEWHVGTIETSGIIHSNEEINWHGTLATFTVTSAADSGAGTLREAIGLANGNLGADTINFNILTGPPGTKTITLTTALPSIIGDNVLIDGTTQPGFDPTTHAPLIRIDGTTAGLSTNGLTLLAGANTVKGLMITNFTNDGIAALAGANTIVGNYIGTDGDSNFGNGRYGIYVASNNNIIGGASDADRNVISGNTSHGVTVFGGNTRVLGNYIGLNAAGTAAIGNGGDGVYAAFQSVIGEVGAGNVISGNAFHGIEIPGTVGMSVSGNYIGTNASGSASVANGLTGIFIWNNAKNNTIGGTVAGAGNVISGNNGSGILLTGTSTQDNRVFGNWIGVAADTTSALGNGINGITIAGSAHDTHIGGVLAGQANVVAFNSGAGVLVTSTSINNDIRLNQIYGNAGLGIDLVAVGILADGVTANDNGSDGDTGANNLQNYPENLSVALSGTTLTITGNQPSPAAAAGTYFFDFYITDTSIVTANGEGKTYIGSASPAVAASGAFTVILTGVSVSGGQLITATVTDLAGNTSEFSVNALIATTAPVNSVPTSWTVIEDSLAAPPPPPGLSVSDSDNDLTTVTLTVSHGVLSATGNSQIAVNVSGGGKTLTLTPASGAILNITLLNSVLGGATPTLKYQPDANYNGPDILTMTSTDALSATDIDTVAINMTPVNDAPTATNLSGAETYTEDTALNLTDIVISDVDSANVTATLTLSNAAAGSLTTGTSGAVSSSYNPGTGVWTASGALADVNALLAGVAFTPTANFDSSFSIATSVSDGVAPAISGSKAITGTAVNDAPVIVANRGGTVNEGAGLVLTSAMLEAHSVDVGAGPVVYTLVNAPTAGVLSLGAVTLAAGDSFTQADIGSAQIRYTHDGSETTADNFVFSVADAHGVAPGPVVFSLTVAPVNDLPIAADRSLATVENVPLLLNLNDFDYVDAEGAPLDRIRVTALPNAGTLMLVNSPVAVNQEVAAADIAAGKLQFVPRQGIATSLSVAIGFQVHDGTAYSASTNTVNVLINPTLSQEATTQPGVVVPIASTEAPTEVALKVEKPAPVPSNAVTANGVPLPQVATMEAALQTAASGDSGASTSAPRSDVFADATQGRSAGVANLQLFSTVMPISFEGGIVQIGIETPKLAAESAVGERSSSNVAGNATFIQQLDRVREEAKAAEETERNVVVSSVTVGAGMSVGYVVWLLRGGLLLTSLLSSLPAWRFVDPLPVLGRLKGEGEADDEDAGESLESIVSGEGADEVYAGQAQSLRQNQQSRGDIPT